jgi:hypothetical protein
MLLRLYKQKYLNQSCYNLHPDSFNLWSTFFSVKHLTNSGVAFKTKNYAGKVLPTKLSGNSAKAYLKSKRGFDVIRVLFILNSGQLVSNTN